jgi:hypothetical protein
MDMVKGLAGKGVRGAAQGVHVYLLHRLVKGCRALYLTSVAMRSGEGGALIASQ